MKGAFDGSVVRRLTSSLFLEGGTGCGGGRSLAGMEKPTMEEVGRAFLREVEELPPEGRRREAQDFLTGGAVAAGGGVGVDSAGVVGAASGAAETTGVASLSSVSSTAGSSTAGTSTLASSTGTAEVDTDVLLDAGDPGIVGVSAFSVTEDDGTVELVWDDTTSVMDSAGGRRVFFFGFAGDDGGDIGGVLVSAAPSTILGGGHARGDMMIPGACAGSRGLRDQIDQVCKGGWVLSIDASSDGNDSCKNVNTGFCWGGVGEAGGFSLSAS